MTIDAGAYRLLGYGSLYAPMPASTPASTLQDVRQDARALIKALKQAQQAQPAQPAPLALPAPPALLAAPPPAPFSLAGLAQALANLWASLAAWLAPSAPPPPGTQPQPQPQPQPQRATRFVVSSFNILGSGHTAPGGDAKGYASGATRARWAAELITQKQVDVVGFQELNRDQVTAFTEATGGTYGIYPGNKTKDPMGSQNSIAWRKDTWDLVESYTVDFPSHRGNLWPSPVVRLRNKATGQEAYFTNFHNAPGFRTGAQQASRDRALAKQVELVNRLKRESGLPVVVTGDMNDKDRYYRGMTQAGGMHAANEGPGGKAPRQMGIDWIFGSAGVSFKGFVRERGALERKVSDHGMLVSQVRIG